jgi:putative acetyltransferase
MSGKLTECKHFQGGALYGGPPIMHAGSVGLSPLRIRHATPDDAVDLFELSLEAIHTSASTHYSAEQLSAWASRRTLEGHQAMIDRTIVLVADIDGVAAGFANLVRQAGGLDQLFVAPWAGGRGAARLLVGAVEAEAIEAGLTEIEARASWRAVEVFGRLGWERVKTEHVQVADQVLGRVHVRKFLDPARI